MVACVKEKALVACVKEKALGDDQKQLLFAVHTNEPGTLPHIAHKIL
jgi:hypothetical protein